MTAAAPLLIKRLGDLLGPKGLTTEPDLMAPWLTDWRGRRTGRAIAMASPTTREQVADIVRAAVAAGVPIVPQGGNTSMVAGATPSPDGDALLVSTRRLAAIRAVSADDNVLVAEAGAVLADVHAAAEMAGRRFPLSLAAKGSATVGGLISTNAGGTQVLRFGTMRALVLGIEAVLPDGSLFEGLSALRKDNRGYDLRQLLAGAEGTLGIITAASLRLVPAAAQRVVAWVGLAEAAAAVRLLRELESALGEAVESFELIPDVALALVLRHIPGTRPPLGDVHRWNVLIEVTAPQADPPLRDLLETALARASDAGLISDATVASNGSQADALWRLRESISEAERIDGMAAKHDVSVPVAAMPAFIEATRTATEARFAGTRVIAFGHLGDGNVHFNVRAPAGVDGGAWLASEGNRVSAFVHDRVIAAGGSISAEHGIGALKLAEFSRTAGSTRLAALRAIKAAFDPGNLMNPGKLVPLASKDAGQ